MFWIAAVLGFITLAAIDAWTLRRISRPSTPRIWRHLTIGLLAIGALLGAWLGFAFTYQVAPDHRHIGFPLPLLVLCWENGRWVDYVGPILLLGPLNVFIIASFCLFPISIGMVTRLLWR
jgi:hypothetical protein